jgi:hypothetical protein
MLNLNRLLTLGAALAALLLTLPAMADTIELENGDKLDVTVVEETETGLIVEHPVFGRMEVPKSALKKPEPEKPGLFGSSFLQGFTRELGLGLAGVNSNVDSFTINANIGLHKETDKYRSHFVATYFYSTASTPENANPFFRGSRATGNQFITDYQHDLILFGSRFFVFGNARYAYDAFQLWRNRLTLAVGPGYEIIKRENMSLRGELGFSGTGTWPRSGIDPFRAAYNPQGELFSLGERNELAGWNPELVVAGVFVWKPLEGQSLSIDATYLPVLTDWSDFRVISNAAYTISIAGIDGLGLKVGLNYEYISDPGEVRVNNLLTGVPDPPISLKNHNIKYFANIVYEF